MPLLSLGEGHHEHGNHREHRHEQREERHAQDASDAPHHVAAHLVALDDSQDGADRGAREPCHQQQLVHGAFVREERAAGLAHHREVRPAHGRAGKPKHELEHRKRPRGLGRVLLSRHALLARLALVLLCVRHRAASSVVVAGASVAAGTR